MIPFAVVGSDQEYQVNGRRILGRKTKWGTIEGTLSLFPYLLSPPPYPDRTTRTPKPPVQVKVYIVLPCSSKENHFPGVRTENTLSNAPASNSWAFVQLGGLLSAGGDTCGCLVAWLLLAAQLKCLTAVFECSADVSDVSEPFPGLWRSLHPPPGIGLVPLWDLFLLPPSSYHRLPF